LSAEEPRVDPQTAWAWGVEHREEFRERAADVLAALLAVEEGAK
jgi:hypothetical protein